MKSNLDQSGRQLLHQLLIRLPSAEPMIYLVNQIWERSLLGEGEFHIAEVAEASAVLQFLNINLVQANKRSALVLQAPWFVAGGGLDVRSELVSFTAGQSISATEQDTKIATSMMKESKLSAAQLDALTKEYCEIILN